jgi:hypothetical protein
MRRRTKLSLLLLSAVFALLGACNSGSNSVAAPPAGSTACVLGTSTLGNCTL